MRAPTITRDRLIQLVSYDKATGLFTRRTGVSNVAAGDTPSYVNRCGHVEFRLDNVLYKAHILAWFYVYGTWPTARLLHRNGDKADNRIENIGYSPCHERTELTAERARYLFAYDDSTGVFTRRTPISNQPVGSIVGCVGVRGYQVANIDGKIRYMHRVAWLYMTGSWPSRKIDHKNRVRTDNRWCNLRIADDNQNAANTTRCGKSKTGVRGVCICKNTGKYVAEVRHNGVRVLYKRFELLEDAARAAAQARDKHHGEFAVHA